MSLNGLAEPLLRLPRLVKQAVVFVVDVLMSMLAVWLAFYLRIDQTGWPVLQQINVYGLAAILFAPVFCPHGTVSGNFPLCGNTGHCLYLNRCSNLWRGIFLTFAMVWLEGRSTQYWLNTTDYFSLVSWRLADCGALLAFWVERC